LKLIETVKKQQWRVQNHITKLLSRIYDTHVNFPTKIIAVDKISIGYATTQNNQARSMCKYFGSKCAIFRLRNYSFIYKINATCKWVKERSNCTNSNWSRLI